MGRVALECGASTSRPWDSARGLTLAMSALGQTQTSGPIRARSVLSPTTDMRRLRQHVRLVPLAEVIRSSSPPPADLDRVFEAFYTTKAGGLGLGLSICRSIIEAHNGRLWASANVPRGAKVSIRPAGDRKHCVVMLHS
jgi:nitrogen-specific signal transduction histidine kinase